MKTSRVSSLPLRKTRTISTRSNDAIERDAGSDDQMAAGRRNVGSRRPHFGIRRQLRTPLVNSIDQFVSGARIVFCKVGPDLGDVTLKAWKIGSDLHSARLRRFASSRRPASFIRRTVAWSKGRGSPLAPPRPTSGGAAPECARRAPGVPAIAAALPERLRWRFHIRRRPRRCRPRPPVQATG